MAFNELDFLTSPYMLLHNSDNKDTIFNDLTGELSVNKDGNIVPSTDVAKKSVVFKRPNVQGTNSIKNYYKDTIYKFSGHPISDANPYLKLIKDFESPTFNAMRFQASDFSYLTNLGVYPINRMWTLRRFTDASVVPNNLQNWGSDKKPEFATETMVGWIDPENETFFNIGFSEKWMKVTERVDQMLMKILEQEFGLKGSVISLPGWSQGLLFGFLKNMGITNFDENDIPMGKPEVLQEAAARAGDGNPGYGNESTFSMTLKTSYEQKFIGDIDPGSAMLDIIEKCTYMGTRDTRYVFGGTDPNGVISSLRKASNGTNADDWWAFIKTVVDAFMNAITETFEALGLSETEPAKEVVTETKDANGNVIKGSTSGEAKKKLTDSLNFLKSTGDKTFDSIIASTLGKWRYALVGSIALMTGENSTPWHLTIGNPYSPFISLGNIIVKSVDLKFNNELAYNDMPTRLDVEVSVELGRNLGAQEIFQMFNNGYIRRYDPVTESSVNTEPKPVTKTQAVSDVNVTKPKDQANSPNTPPETTPPVESTVEPTPTKEPEPWKAGEIVSSGTIDSNGAKYRVEKDSTPNWYVGYVSFSKYVITPGTGGDSTGSFNSLSDAINASIEDATNLT